MSTSECDNSCSGYPSDVCGGDGLYGYMALSKSPSGTASSSSSATSSSPVSQHQTTASAYQRNGEHRQYMALLSMTVVYLCPPLPIAAFMIPLTSMPLMPLPAIATALTIYPILQMLHCQCHATSSFPSQHFSTSALTTSNLPPQSNLLPRRSFSDNFGVPGGAQEGTHQLNNYPLQPDFDDLLIFILDFNKTNK